MVLKIKHTFSSYTFEAYACNFVLQMQLKSVRGYSQSSAETHNEELIDYLYGTQTTLQESTEAWTAGART